MDRPSLQVFFEMSADPASMYSVFYGNVDCLHGPDQDGEVARSVSH